MANIGEQKVIARFLDGRCLKGVTLSFRHDAAYFHIEPVEDPYGEGTRVNLSELKAVCFVKSFEGDPGHKERSVFDHAPGYGRPIRVRFTDGEEITGVLQHAIDTRDAGFFLYPADPASNNERIFAIRSAVSKVDELPAGVAGAALEAPASA